jgi:hypothetical protein
VGMGPPYIHVAWLDNRPTVSSSGYTRAPPELSFHERGAMTRGCGDKRRAGPRMNTKQEPPLCCLFLKQFFATLGGPAYLCYLSYDYTFGTRTTTCNRYFGRTGAHVQPGAVLHVHVSPGTVKPDRAARPCMLNGGSAVW